MCSLCIAIVIVYVLARIDVHLVVKRFVFEHHDYCNKNCGNCGGFYDFFFLGDSKDISFNVIPTRSSSSTSAAAKCENGKKDHTPYFQYLHLCDVFVCVLYFSFIFIGAYHCILYPFILNNFCKRCAPNTQAKQDEMHAESHNDQ